MRFLFSLALAPLSLVACATTPRQANPELLDPTTQVMPTLYLTERFFVRPVTTRGDTVTLFTDTGDNGRLFQASIEKLRWHIDTVATSRGSVMLADLPAFEPSRSVPASVPAPIRNTRMVVAPPTDRFDTLMSRRAIGQLGQPWFESRIWTFDYPGQRLLLHATAPARRATDREIRFEYRTDTAGKPLNSTPRLGVEVDGDSLLLIFDTGATVWLTDSAMTAMHDGRPAERSWSLVRNATYRAWRAKHPEWRVIERANQVNGSDMIEVPSIRIAGFDVGPVWFGTIPDRPANVPPAPLRTRLDGTLGGDALRFFSVTVDYPAQVMVFRLTPLPARQTSRPQGRVVGDLRIHPFTSTVFGNERRLRVLVPEGYDLPANRSRRYPVLYLNDGQNLFDSTTAVLNPLEWRIDETIADLTRRGRIPPLIVVGIDNAGRQGRFREYFPWVDAYLQPPEPHPQGMKYPSFLVDEVLPFINARYRTLTDAEHTGLGGSSAGGLAALRAVIDRPGVFGRLLIESPSIYLDDYHILRDATSLRQWPSRIFLGVGTNESNRPTCPPDVSAPGRLADDVERLRELIIHAGIAESNVRKVVIRCGLHDERAWGDRFPDAVQFLLGY